MNKKFLIGLSVFGMATGFWACGDGEIITKGDDEVNAATTDENMINQMKDKAIADCLEDPACEAKMNKAENVPEPESSDNGGDTPAPGGDDEGGNGGNGGGPVPNTSSSKPTIPSGSSTDSSGSGSPDQPPPSSASTVTDASVPDGSCKGSATAITKGGQVTWTFTPATLDLSSLSGGITEKLAQQNAYADLVNSSTCEWTIEGAATTSVSGPCGGDGKTVTATYAGITKTGFAASIKLGEKTIPCGSVVVKGLPVTGCACTSPTLVEITEDPVATWSVACASTNETITGWSWTGAEGNTASATYTFTAKGQTVVPKVTVSTAESDTTVTCKSPKVTDANDPDYNIALTSTITKLEPGDYTITACSGGGQICCSTLDGTEKTITLNGAECKAFAGQGWGSCGGGSCKAGSLSTEYTIQCAGCW